MIRRGSRLLLPWTRGGGTALLAQATDELGRRGDELRRARAGTWAMAAAGMRGDAAAMAALQASVEQIRLRRQMLAAERDALIRACAYGLPQEGPHAHLHCRALPNVYPDRTRVRVLRAWSAVSASLLLGAVILVPVNIRDFFAKR